MNFVRKAKYQVCKLASLSACQFLFYCVRLLKTFLHLLLDNVKSNSLPLVNLFTSLLGVLRFYRRSRQCQYFLFDALQIVLWHDRGSPIHTALYAQRAFIRWGSEFRWWPVMLVLFESNFVVLPDRATWTFLGCVVIILILWSRVNNMGKSAHMKVVVVKTLYAVEFTGCLLLKAVFECH